MDYRRNFHPGGAFFFTLVAYRRRRLFEESAACTLLRRTVHEVKRDRPFRIEAWVLLPDHIHMIWTLPPTDADFSTRWARIKSQFTRQWRAAGGQDLPVSPGKRRDNRRGIWQPKFFEHTIRDEDDFTRHVDYIHYNPVKHGEAKRPRDWPLTSFHAYVERGVYTRDWGCPTLPLPPHAESLPYGEYE